jgi:hypothetical protein
MDRQSSTSGNGSYRDCSKIFDPHGDGSSIGPRDYRTFSEMVPERAASSSMRRLGAPIASPSVPNGVTIRSQGTKARVETLEARDRRSPLTTWRMSRIAKGSYSRAAVLKN